MAALRYQRFDLDPPKEGKASCGETIDKSQQKVRYPEYCGKVVRLGIDIQTLEYFASKIVLDPSKLRTPCNGDFLLKTVEEVLQMHLN